MGKALPLSPIAGLAMAIGWPDFEGCRCDMAGACRRASQVDERRFSPTALSSPHEQLHGRAWLGDFLSPK
jgi:hypothetical protein